MARRRAITSLLFWLTFWPGATLAAHGGAERLGGAAREGRASSCWPGSCRAWIVLELVITKLPHYVLPLYPAIAILIAGVVDPAYAVARSAG